MVLKKLWLAVPAGVATVAIAFAACGGGAASAKGTSAKGGEAAKSSASVKGKTLDFIAVNPTNAYVLQTWATAKAIAQKEGIKITETGVTASNPQNEVNAIEDAATADQYDGYMIVPQNATEDIPAVKQLVKTGKPVVSDSIALGPNLCQLKPQVQGMAGSSLTPICDVAQAFGTLTKESCADLHPCNILWLVGLPGFPGEEKMLAGVQAAVKTIPGATLTLSSPTQYDITTATSVTQTELVAHPKTNLIWASAGQMFVGAEKALPKNSKIKIATDGGIIQQIQALKSGHPDVTGIVMGNGLPRTDTVNAMAIMTKALVDKKYRMVGVNSIKAAGIPMIFSKSNEKLWASFKPQDSVTG